MGKVVKFQQMIPLLQYLESTKTSPFCYLVLEQDREERKRMIRKLIEKLEGKVSFFEGGEWAPVYSALSSPSLFGEEEIVVWDGVKKLSEEAIKSVNSYMKSPSSNCFFILGGESSKPFASLEGTVILDTTEEKPWDKEKRVQQELLFAVKEMDKTITPGALSLLLTASGGEGPILEKELLKVSLYVGEKREIKESDVLAVTHFSGKAKGFKQAESLVFGGPFIQSEVDVSSFISLVGQVRFLLQQGRQVCWLLQERKGAEEIAKILGMRSKGQVQKVIDKLKGRDPGYFDRALSDLYDLELLSKSSTLSPAVLLDTLRIKFRKLKREYAR